jgi:hypothetical protein
MTVQYHLLERLNTPPLPRRHRNVVYYELPLPLVNGDGVYDQIGIGGQFSRAYYTFGMFIPCFCRY